MQRILIVSRDIHLKQDGGTLVSKRNERLLQKLGFKTERFIIPIPSLATRITNILFRQSYGSSKSLLRSFKNILKKDYDYLFFDGSIYGGFLKFASQLGYKTICFYHNVEAEYYKQKAAQTGLITDKLMVSYIHYNERISTQNANGIIALNTRDSKLLESKYGRGADIIIPTSFPNRNIKEIYDAFNNDTQYPDPYLLFVGTNFFANYEGLNRFILNIAPKTNWKIKVVGNISDAFRNRHDIPNNVEFLGRVDSLDKLYIESSGVVAPIFSGSGFKTKTAEALSFGKTVIGYSEAFEGIDHEENTSACIVVTSDNEFIDKLNNLCPYKRYNEISEKLFHDKLSDDAQIHKFSILFQRLESRKS